MPKFGTKHCSSCGQVGHYKTTCGIVKDKQVRDEERLRLLVKNSQKGKWLNEKIIKNTQPFREKKENLDFAYNKYSKKEKLKPLTDFDDTFQLGESQISHTPKSFGLFDGLPFDEIKKMVKRNVSDNPENYELFAKEAARDDLYNLIVTPTLITSDTPENVVRLVAETNPLWSMRQLATKQLKTRKLVNSTFIPVPEEEEERMAQLFRTYKESQTTMPDGKAKFTCLRPDVCGVKYHYVAPLTGPYQVRRASTIIAMGPPRCKATTQLLKNASATISASSTSAIHGMKRKRLPVGDYGGVSETVEKVYSEEYDSYSDTMEERIAGAHVRDNWKYPYLLAENYITDTEGSYRLPPNLVDNKTLDIYTLGKMFENLDGLQHGSAWNVETYPDNSRNEDVSIQPIFEHTPTKAARYKKFFDKNSSQRVVAALATEYINIPVHIANAQYRVEKMKPTEIQHLLSDPTGTTEGETGDMVKKPATLPNVSPTEPPYEDAITAVIYRHPDGRVELLDGRKRLMRELENETTHIYVVLGEPPKSGSVS